MRNVFLLFFCLVVAVTHAQMTDNFSDGNFSSNPNWIGDTSDFIVNSSAELQLNAAIAGESFLSVPISISLSDSIEWRFRIKQDFAPSSSNYSRIFLMADQSDPTLSLNGYFLQFGEALSNDAVQLFRQSGTVITSVCRGPDAQIAAAFDLQMRVTRFSSGEWKIYSKEDGGGEQLLCLGIDLGSLPGQFLTLDCNFTSGNINHFHFDDFYVGPIVPDLIKPFVTTFNVISDSTLSISFSENLKVNDVFSLANYSIAGAGLPSSIAIDSTNDYSIQLFYNQHFISGNHYSLTVSGLNDLSGNQLNDTLISFDYFPVANGKVDDVIFNEIYFEPSSLSPLPIAEFIELYNRSDSAIQLSNWKLSDGSSTAVFPDHLFSPKTYLLVFDQNNLASFSSIQNKLAVVNFPGLNNDTGDSMSLKNASDQIISTTIFNDNSYHDSHKKSGGWTIERVDQNFTCDQIDNWKASVETPHGTPGFASSVSGNYFDTLPPIVEMVFEEDSVHLSLHFSEELFSTISSLNFAVIDSQNAVNDCINVEQLSTNGVTLTFLNPFSSGMNRLLIRDSLYDCSGNLVDTSLMIPFGKSEPAKPGDVVINEILFDPVDGGDDFVELYNCSSKIIDLSNWIISENDIMDPSIVKDESLITTEHRLLFPADFLVLNRNPENLQQLFYCPYRNKLMSLPSLPDYNADNGKVMLYDENGTVIDAMNYADTMQFYLLNSPKGVSLERLNGYHGEKENVQWHSAASSVGFATPGYRNSQWIGETKTTGRVEVVNEVFSPDNDGFDDMLAVHYHFDDPGTTMSLRIYTKEGIPVRDVLINESLAIEGDVFWDGFSNDGRLALPGRYLVWAKTFAENGSASTFRTSCVVALTK